MNTIKVTLMMTGLVALFMWIGYAFAGEGGMLIAFGIATVINVISFWFSDKIVLKMYKAREIKESDHPRLFRVVRRVSTAAMIPMPKVYIIPTKAPNAFATGRSVDHAAVAATEGLIELLSEDELEGVMGHEIAHVINRDMLIGTVAATIAGAIGMIASMARFAAIFGGMGSRDSEGRGGNPIALLVAAILAPLIAIIIQTAISRQREYKADAVGGRFTNKHLSLASALQKIHKSPVKMNLDENPATAHLMIANPLSGRGIANLFSTHPPVEKRIEALNKLAQDSIYSHV
jgi:heat shock protein HtpX